LQLETNYNEQKHFSFSSFHRLKFNGTIRIIIKRRLSQVKIEKLQDYILERLSGNSENFDWHIKVWSDVFKEFPDNEKEIHDLINSSLFRYDRQSVFNMQWPYNPIVDAIMSSDYAVDILFYDDKNMINKRKVADSIYMWFFTKLSILTPENLARLNPIVFDDLKEYWDYTYLAKREINSSKPNLSILKNLIHYLFFNLFCLDKTLRYNALETNDLWGIISCGIDIPISLLRESFDYPSFIPNNEYKKWGARIWEFYKTKNIPKSILRKFETETQLDNIEKFLENVIKDESLVLLYNLNS